MRSLESERFYVLIRSQLTKSLFLALFSVFLAACSLEAAQPRAAPPQPVFMTETPTPQHFDTPTATIVWFPPTATFTPFPTQVITPTQDLSPKAGEIILSDDFTEPAHWSLSRTASSSTALGKKELSLALSQSGGYVYSLRQGTALNDFYLEITASTGICRGSDEYGLLLRVTDALEFFRFSLTCDGQLRLDKYVNGRASSPQPLSYSGAVPRGAPGESRLGVWAVGKELRFYVNGHYEFTIQDSSLLSGGIGVFVRSAGENAVSVSFSDLVVRKVEE